MPTMTNKTEDSQLLINIYKVWQERILKTSTIINLRRWNRPVSVF